MNRLVTLFTEVTRKNSMIGWIALCPCLLWVGCQILPEIPLTFQKGAIPNPRQVGQKTWKSPAPRPSEPTLVGPIRERFQKGNWSARVSWSPFTLSEQIVRQPTRTPEFYWEFHRAAVNKPAEKTVRDEGTTAVPPAPPIPVDPLPWLIDQAKVDPAFAAERDDAISWLCEQRDPAGWTAAIAVARQNPQDGVRWLTVLEDLAFSQDSRRESAATPAPSDNLVAAAIEAWCAVVLETDDEPVDSLAAAGRLLERPDLPMSVRQTLLREVGSRIPPAWTPSLETSLALRSDGQPIVPEHFLAAWQATVLYAARWKSLRQMTSRSRTETVEDLRGINRISLSEDAAGAAADYSSSACWPQNLALAKRNADPTIRRLCGRWMALTNHPETIATLGTALWDTDLRVREAAVISLGMCDQTEAHQMLAKLARHTDEIPRALSMQGMNHPDDLEVFLEDKSAKVRAGLARELAKYPELRTALWARRLLTDKSMDVQLAALEGIENWPEEFAGPLILFGLEHGLLKTRLECQLKMKNRFGFEPHFPVEGSDRDRAEAASELVSVAPWPTTWWSQIRESARKRLATERGNLGEEELLARFRELEQLPPRSVDAHDVLEGWPRTLTAGNLLEGWVLASPNSETRTWLVEEALPKYHPIQAVLFELKSPEIENRRNAIRQLQSLVKGRELTAHQQQQLNESLVKEHDRIVWQEALRMAADQPLPGMRSILLQAVHHQWPDLRKGACQLMEQRPDRESCLWLLPLLADEDRTVRIAAIRALGACGHQLAIDGLPERGNERAVPGLRTLLTNTDPELRSAVLGALVRLRDEQAFAEAQRLLASNDPAVRQQGARILGGSGQRRAIEPLVKAGWTERSSLVQRELLASLNLLTTREERPQGLLEPGAGSIESGRPEEELKRWATWFEGQRGK